MIDGWVETLAVCKTKTDRVTESPEETQSSRSVARVRIPGIICSFTSMTSQRGPFRHLRRKILLAGSRRRRERCTCRTRNMYFYRRKQRQQRSHRNHGEGSESEAVLGSLRFLSAFAVPATSRLRHSDGPSRSPALRGGGWLFKISAISATSCANLQVGCGLCRPVVVALHYSPACSSRWARSAGSSVRLAARSKAARASALRPSRRNTCARAAHHG